MLAWAFIPNFSCPSADNCTMANNMGWRYLVLTLGAFTFCGFIGRFFFFTLYESPKFLVSRGRQDEAVASVQGIAYKNKTTTWLTEEILADVGGVNEVGEKEGGLSTMEILKRNLSKFSGAQIKPLFADRRLAISST